MTKLNYFDQLKSDTDDIFLQMAIVQGYIPRGCLLGGKLVMGEIGTGKDPCHGCEGPRDKCNGRPKQDL